MTFTFRSETPPLHPGACMLRADLGRGEMGDKATACDPGLSRLGTDDETVENAPSQERIALIRRTND